MRVQESAVTVREWRLAHAMSVNALARALGVTRQRIWRWENQGVADSDVGLVRLALRQVDIDGRLSILRAAAGALLDSSNG